MRHLAILAALSLASCTAIQQRQACQQATGPEPDAYTHAFGMLGIVGAMTWFSVSGGLVHPASRLIRAQGKQGAIPGYSELVRTYLGHRITQLLNVFLLANSLGYAGG